MEERLFRVPRPRKSTAAQLRARKRYADNHPDEIKARRAAGAEKLTIYNKQKRAALRLETLSHYGPAGQLRCSWENCFITDPDMLVLDHINNNGASQRKSLGGRNCRGWNFYDLLKNLGFPPGYQTLCCNHNHKKELVRSRNK